MNREQADRSEDVYLGSVCLEKLKCHLKEKIYYMGVSKTAASVHSYP